jgi:hypothetical protein
MTNETQVLPVDSLLATALQTKLLEKIVNNFFYKQANQKTIAYISTQTDKSSKKIYVELQDINALVAQVQQSIGEKNYRHGLIQLTCLQRFCARTEKRLDKVFLE